TLDEIRASGLYKAERTIVSPQGPHIRLGGGDSGSTPREMLNFCANNYLGLADHPKLEAAAKAAIDSHGFGMASVRFICGTGNLHTDLEQRVAEFLEQDAAILFSSCFDANGGLFESLLGPDDAILSDTLNHASIIDGVRLCKAKRYSYANNDMTDLETKLIEAADAQYRLIATDGVFSMDGIVANLPAICDLADKYDAMVMVDDSHAVGFMGPSGGGTPDHFGLAERIDIVTGTFGKALGGASGGYVASSGPVVDLLRQRARPYLFSNSLAPMICAATIAALDLLGDEPERIARVHDNARLFRAAMTDLGFDLAGADHPIIPVMVGDAVKAGELASRLEAQGVFVTAFSYPVVPMDTARIRTQMSAAHSSADLERCIAAFALAGRDLGLIS
ncbi:MAG: glycine C-acetyltransferase, partial [Alphaproteobacteria bacterium]